MNSLIKLILFIPFLIIGCSDEVKDIDSNSSKESLVAMEKLYIRECATCHGRDGKEKPLEKSAIVANQSKDELFIKIKEYRDGTRNIFGMGNLMQSRVVSLSDRDIEALATYISNSME